MRGANWTTHLWWPFLSIGNFYISVLPQVANMQSVLMANLNKESCASQLFRKRRVRVKKRSRQSNGKREKVTILYDLPCSGWEKRGRERESSANMHTGNCHQPLPVSCGNVLLCQLSTSLLDKCVHRVLRQQSVLVIILHLSLLHCKCNGPQLITSFSLLLQQCSTSRALPVASFFYHTDLILQNWLILFFTRNLTSCLSIRLLTILLFKLYYQKVSRSVFWSKLGDR